LSTLGPDAPEIGAIDAALKKWRQGDLALEESWFVHVGDRAVPLTEMSGAADGDGLQALTSEVEGLAVVTQSCDIVRPCLEQPYVEVSPVVRLNAEELPLVQCGRLVRLTTLPPLLALGLGIDLERVMTIEKSAMTNWVRTPGCTSDEIVRAFAQALARRRSRFAFPDDFTGLVDKLRRRMISKHGKDTNEGRGLRALREIRVLASPSWDSGSVELFFLFIRHDTEAGLDSNSWADLLKEWLSLVPKSGRFMSVEGQVSTLEELSGGDYAHSDPLDLDHLSSSSKAI
jgi:hypothetical protein